MSTPTLNQTRMPLHIPAREVSSATTGPIAPKPSTIQLARPLALPARQAGTERYAPSIFTKQTACISQAAFPLPMPPVLPPAMTVLLPAHDIANNPSNWSFVFDS